MPTRMFRRALGMFRQGLRGRIRCSLMMGSYVFMELAKEPASSLLFLVLEFLNQMFIQFIVYTQLSHPSINQIITNHIKYISHEVNIAMLMNAIITMISSLLGQTFCCN